MSRNFQWEDLLASVAKKIPPQQFRAWIETTKFVELNATSLVICAPTLFSRDWIHDHYRDVFATSMFDLYGLQLELTILLEEEALNKAKPSPTSETSVPMHSPLLESAGSRPSPMNSPSSGMTQTEGLESENLLARGSPASDRLSSGLPLFDLSQEHLTSHEDPTGASSDNLQPSNNSSNSYELENSAIQANNEGTHTAHSFTNDSYNEHLVPVSVRDMAAPIVRTLGQPLVPKHTFETFVVGASNQFAHAAARAVAEQPATQYNPLFLYSDAGLGKTHLLHAIGNYVLRINPKAKICYISAEKFVNDLIDSIHHGKMSQFREKYRDSYDMLLMDDIQFIAGKDRTQEEFFHTFNALHSSRRQIVVTSDKFPKDIPGLEDRIRTRFEWGLIADIQPPEIETRIAILRAKAEIDDIFLPNDVALFLASNIKTNIRELEGALIRLGAQASLSGSEISIDLAKQLLKNLIKEPASSISADAILDAVGRYFTIKPADIRGRDRSRRIAIPRQIAMFLIRKYCGKSYPEIGILLGGKDHSTVLHGVKSITSEIERDPEIRRHVEDIQNSL